jgi:molybdenum cofactor biosynthesis enzyme
MQMKLNVLQIIKDQKQKQNRLHKAQIAQLVGAKKC